MVVDFLFANIPLLLVMAGAGLIIAEAFAPGAHFFVVGVALFAAGLVGVVLPASLGVLNIVIMTGVIVAASMGTLWAYREVDIYGGQGKAKTSDSESLRGKTGQVTKRVTPTDGEVKLSEGGFNPYYQARSVDGTISEGKEVMVLDPGGGNVVTVESVSAIGDEIDRELERDRRQTDRDHKQREQEPTESTTGNS
jgi:membrane protein implicated in regulation of membrane protease activity